jgi:hypothetical protein
MGEKVRNAVYRYGMNAEDTGEFGVAITAPAEQLVFDVIVHQELEFALKPEVLVFAHISPHGHHSGGSNDSSRLPIRAEVIELRGQPPVVNTPAIPQYPQLIKSVYERMNWNPEQFRGIRLMMKYPPLGSHIVLRFPLQMRPKS